MILPHPRKTIATFTLALLVTACAEQTEQAQVDLAEAENTATTEELPAPAAIILQQPSADAPQAAAAKSQVAHRNRNFGVADSAMETSSAGFKAYHQPQFVDRENYLH